MTQVCPKCGCSNYSEKTTLRKKIIGWTDTIVFTVWIGGLGACFMALFSAGKSNNHLILVGLFTFLITTLIWLVYFLARNTKVDMKSKSGRIVITREHLDKEVK